jgi:hypothetical protein
MRKIIVLLAAICAASPALADWSGKDATGATITFKNPNVCTSVVCVPISSLVDATGAAVGTAGAPLRVDPTGTTTQPVSAAASSLAVGSGTDGWNVTEGTKADAAWVSGSGSLVAISKTIANAVAGALPTGANSVGYVGSIPNVTPTDCSLALTTGGTAQNIIAAASTIHGFTIANIDTSEVLWMSFTTTAAASTIASYPLAPATATTFAGLSSYTTPPGFGSNHAVSVVAATTGHKISCTSW